MFVNSGCVCVDVQWVLAVVGSHGVGHSDVGTIYFPSAFDCNGDEEKERVDGTIGAVGSAWVLGHAKLISFNVTTNACLSL